MNGERINTNTNNNGWGELQEQPFVGGIDTSNWQRTASGIFLPPKKPQRNPVRLEKPLAKPKIEEVAPTAKEVAVEEVVTEEEMPETEEVTPDEEMVPIAEEVELATEKMVPVVEKGIPIAKEEVVASVAEEKAKPVIEKIDFIQSTEEANRLKSNPEYFTWLVSAEHGIAVKRDDAITFYEEQLKSAQDDKEMSEILRMERSILDSSGEFSEEEKQRVKDFANTPEMRKKKIEHELRSSQKLLESAEKDVEYREGEYLKYKSMNLVAKFINRDAKSAAEDRLRWAMDSRQSIQNRISQLEDELTELSEAA